jgi:hypothetical protein
VEIISDLAGGYNVWCGTCGTEGPPEEAEAAAIAAWNRRAGHTAAAERIAGLEAERARLLKAGNALSFAAQITGGVAGRDEGLVHAIDGWARAKALNRIERFEPDGTVIAAAGGAFRKAPRP